MNEPQINLFDNLASLTHKFDDESLKPLWDEVKSIQDNFDSATKSNKDLAGNIKKEYDISSSKDYMEGLLLPIIESYYYNINPYHWFLTNSIMTENSKFKLDTMWVNYQQKHEFNPIHNHIGDISFVIWLKVPYTIQEEMEHTPDIPLERNTAGQFCFLYNNALGNIVHQNIPVDKTFENMMIMFPAKMMHGVYPFFTSDEYRISVAGNFIIEK